MSTLKPLSAKITVIIHATEDPNKVAQAVRNISPDNVSTPAIVNAVKGHYGNRIQTLTSAVKSPKMVERLLLELWTSLSFFDRNEVYSSLPSRVDRAGTLFLRVDKQEAMKGRIRLQDSDPIKIGISFTGLSGRQTKSLDDFRKTLDDLQ
jgi:RNA binding exosome subunit